MKGPWPRQRRPICAVRTDSAVSPVQDSTIAGLCLSLSRITALPHGCFGPTAGLSRATVLTILSSDSTRSRLGIPATW